MEKKKALGIARGDTIVIGGDKLKVTETETSDIGKQGTKKVRIVAQKENGETIVIIRPADYPLETN